MVEILRSPDQLEVVAVEIKNATDAAARVIHRAIAEEQSRLPLDLSQRKDYLDDQAVGAIRASLSEAGSRYVMVECEGGNTDSPRFHQGEVLGNPDSSPSFDMVCDPLDGTSSAARGQGAAFSLLLAAPQGSIYRPNGFGFDIYCGRGMEELDRVNQDPFTLGLERTIGALAEIRGVSVDELRIALLERPFQKELAARIKAIGAQVWEIPGAAETIGGLAAVYRSGKGTVQTEGFEQLAIPQADLLIGKVGAPESVILAGMANAFGSGYFVREQDPQTRLAQGPTLTGREVVAQDGVVSISSILDNPLLSGTRLNNGQLIVPQITIRG